MVSRGSIYPVEIIRYRDRGNVYICSNGSWRFSEEIPCIEAGHSSIYYLDKVR